MESDAQPHNSPLSEFSGLMQKSQGGDKESYRLLLKRIAPILLRFVQSQVGYLDQTDDIVQDILMSIHRSRHTYRRNHDFLPWMYTIARRRMIDAIRKSRNIWNTDELPDDNHLPSPLEPAEDERLKVVLHALTNLPTKYRQPIELTKVQGLSVNEAALKLGVSVSAFKTRCSRGYDLLRKKVERIIGDQEK